MPSAEVLYRASEVLPLPLDDLEIMRRSRAILGRRLLPHLGSAVVGAATQPAPSPALHAASPSSAALSRGRGQATRPVRSAFRGASRSSRRGRAALHRAGPSSSGRGDTDRGAAASSLGQPCSDDSDSDNQPLLHRRRRRPASPNPYRGRPAAFRSAPTTAEGDSPDDHQNPVPTEPVPEPTPAPPGADAGPSQPSFSARHRYRTTIPSEAALARRPDAPASLLMMKGCLDSLWAESMDQMGDASPLAQMDRFSKSWAKTHAESLVLNQSFHTLHHESKELQERVSELELQLNDPAQASYVLRAEIQALTNQTDRQKRSLIQVKDELRAMREEKAASEAGFQQQLAHQAQEIQSKNTLLQDKNNKLEVQAAQLETQAAELRELKAELSQSRAALTGVSTALTVYQEGEEDRWGTLGYDRALYDGWSHQATARTGLPELYPSNRLLES
ncbi:MAP7 domain-containing protein 1-like [Zingiber officinale]|uniref:MAP7 domain-containing protein 1-like n=1 Tax=Zingiber officinale TaxID=94328 RepID=UPI001C4CB5F7|nr:MAP7 domain-containing protein 1-like [Zingiber officinale]